MNWKDKLYENYLSTGMAGNQLEKFPKYFEKHKYFAHRIIKYFDKQKDIKIVDLGCGSGGLLYCLKKLGYFNLVGVDYSSEQVKIAKEAGLNFIHEGDLLSFLDNIDNNSVDIFILMDVIEHFERHELFDLLSLMKKKLKSNARVIAHIPNAEGIFGNRIRYGDITHEIAFTRLSISQLFKGNGYSYVACYEDKPIIHSFLSMVRRIIWEIGTVPHRILFAAETGDLSPILSQNMLIVVES